MYLFVAVQPRLLRLRRSANLHITQYTDFALRVLLYLGADPERLATIGEIAERYAISRSHLMKVVSQLVQDGVVEGLRGKGGGIRLAKPAKEIWLGPLVRRLEPEMALVDCFRNNSQCAIDGHCRLKGVFAEAMNAFMAVLNRYTLADLLSAPQELRQILHLE